MVGGAFDSEKTITQEQDPSGWSRIGMHLQNTMLNCVQDMLGTGSRRGFDPVTHLGQYRVGLVIEWALSDMHGVHDLAEYESRPNYIVPLYEGVVVCAYDTSKFPAALLDDVLQAHPYMLADGRQ